MPLRIAGIPVFYSPSEVVAGARSVIEWTDQIVGLLASLPERVETLLGEAERAVTTVNSLVSRVDRVTGAAETVVGDAAGATQAAQRTIVEATEVAQRAATTLVEATDVLGAGSRLLDLYRPIAENAAPLAQRFVADFSESELLSAIKVVDALPALAKHVESDVLPLLGTLNRVGPDVQEMLGVVKDLRKVMEAMPGYNLLRRRE